MHFGALKLCIRGNSTKEEKIARIEQYIKECGDIKNDDGAGCILIWAIDSECEVEVIESIIGYYDEFASNEIGFIAFNLALKYGLYDVARILIKHGANIPKAIELKFDLICNKIENEIFPIMYQYDEKQEVKIMEGIIDIGYSWVLYSTDDTLLSFDSLLN